jgi:hypothetical protein
LVFPAKKRDRSPEEVARMAVARAATTVSGHQVKLTLAVPPRDVAEYIGACAIREGKNTPSVVAKILADEMRRDR